VAFAQSRTMQTALGEQRTTWAVVLFPVVFVTGMGIGKLMPRLYRFAVREDSLVEWATAIAYVVAAIFAGALARHLWRRRDRLYAALYGLLTLGFFLIAMEEISWGQRIFDFSTPGSFGAINAQGEMNFHNWSSFPLHEAYIVVGLYGAFARIIAMPILGRRYRKLVELLTAPYSLFLYFAIPLAYYAHSEYLYYTELVPAGLQWREYWAQHQHFVNYQDQEPIELLLSIGFLLFVAMNWSRYSPAAAAGGRHRA
jgi:hypothetical protein